MEEKYIALLDSGVGGLALLYELIKIMPHEKYIYLGDNKNAPYGSRTQSDLLELSVKNTEELMRYGIKALVLACNTLSATVLHKLEYYARVKTFGVYPPAESCVMRGERTLLCATPLTAGKYTGIKGLDVLSLNELAKDVERKKFELSAIDLEWHLSRGNLIPGGSVPARYDTVILGCTHYEFIKSKFYDHFRPRRIISGCALTARMVKDFCSIGNKAKKVSKNQLIFAGECAYENRLFFETVVKGSFM